MLTAACAGVLAVVNTMQAPVWFRLGVAIYLMLMAAYVILRVPHIYRIWKRTGRRRKELEALLAEARAAAEEARANSAGEQSTTPTTPANHDG